MESIQELLEAKGCKTLEEYEDKIKAEALDPVVKTLEAKDSQIENMEKIIGTQGTTIGTLKKQIEEKLPEPIPDKEKNLEKEKEADDGQNSTEKSEEQYRQENEAVEAELSEDQLQVLDKTLQSLDDEARKLVLGSEQGRAAFRNQILGETGIDEQATFRRPVKKEKLSIEEQIKNALEKSRPGTAPRLQPSGSGVSMNNNNNKHRHPLNIHPAISHSGSLRNSLEAIKKR